MHLLTVKDQLLPRCFQACVRVCCVLSPPSLSSHSALASGAGTCLPPAEHYWPGWCSCQTCSGGVEKAEGESMTKQESTFHAKSDATSVATSYVYFSSSSFLLRPQVAVTVPIPCFIIQLFFYLLSPPGPQVVLPSPVPYFSIASRDLNSCAVYSS